MESHYPHDQSFHFYIAQATPPRHASPQEYYLQTYNTGFAKLEPVSDAHFLPSSPASSFSSAGASSPVSSYRYKHNSLSRSSSLMNFEPPPPAPDSCGCGCGGGAIVPQADYQNPQLPFSPEYRETITFSMSDGRCGISMRAALDKDFGGLKRRDDPMLERCGTSISLRIQWPGCSAWTKQIKTRDWRKTPRPISRGKLATEVAKATRKFVDAMQKCPQTDPHWSVGYGDNQIDINDLVLIRLERVSRASWQPHFRLLSV